LVRIARTPHDLWLDLSGMSALQIQMSSGSVETGQ
jgi:hypothetical protein